jgi:putative transposase
MSEMYQRLEHSSWDCKYHVVFVPKRRRKVLFGQARRKLGEVFHALARQKECQIIEGHLLPDHVHMCIAIPPKYPVASVMRRLWKLPCAAATEWFTLRPNPMWIAAFSSPHP